MLQTSSWEEKHLLMPMGFKILYNTSQVKVFNFLPVIVNDRIWFLRKLTISKVQYDKYI